MRLAGARELDARGCYVLPGGFDPHAHVYEGLRDAPGAALRSGTTAVEAYAPPAPGERVEDACARWRALAAGSACRIEPLATVYEPRRARRGLVRGARRAGRTRDQALPGLSRARHGRRRRAARARAAVGPRVRRRAAAALRERRCDPGAARAAARRRRSRRRRASALASAAGRGGGHPPRARPRPPGRGTGLRRARLDGGRGGGHPPGACRRRST